MRILVVVTLCLALAGCVSAGDKNATESNWKPIGPWPKMKSDTTAWDYITSNPDLSSIAGVLKQLGLDAKLKGPFTGTLLLPTNDAVAAYLAKVSGPTDGDFFTTFFGKLISYHIVARWAITQQPASIALTTLYSNSYVAFGSHKVTYVVDNSTGTAAPKNWGYYPKGRGKEPLPMLYTVAYIMDEQGNQVTFKTRDIPVMGGGVIQVINAVLQPNDLYPSYAVALTNPAFSTLVTVLGLIQNATGVDVAALLDKTPGTLAAPINSAFPPDAGSLPADVLLKVVQFHFCPAASADALLYYPFPGAPYNPCLTLLGQSSGKKSLRLTYKSTKNMFPEPASLYISYPTGKAATPTKGKSDIVIPNISTPGHVTHAISKLLIPPL